MKTKLFKMAWAIADKFSTFADALRHAWKVIKLSAKMHDTIVPFLFIKKDGSTRLAAGTLKEDLIGEVKGDTGRSKNWSILTYYDVEINQWRSAKIENIKI